MRVLILAVTLTAGLAVAATAKPIQYELPEETAELAPGPGLDVAQANCVACHQATGKGMPPAFPPLEGAEKVLGARAD